MNKDLLIKIVCVLAIVGMGLFIFNQFIEWQYNAQLLMGPCQLCVEINPDVGSCWEMQKAIDLNQLPKIQNG